MIDSATATKIIESLRRGLPPQRGTRDYAVGHEKLTQGIKRFHLAGIPDRGIIRFVSGSWGAGKTHFFRLMREEAFEAGCLVSVVELSVNEAPLNKFERVLYAIIRSVLTPSCFSGEISPAAAPIGIVLREALAFFATGVHGEPRNVTFEQVSAATDRLMACQAIDIDFRKIVKAYWETFLPDAPDPVVLEQKRDELLQWFSGEGTVGNWRKRHNINKLVTKDNAKLILQSLAAFIQLVGYKGLVILFDEAEMSYSVMRKSALRDAQNNLLHLLNNIDGIAGLFLIYATTPDFYTDPRHGIVTFGALAGRIGRPADSAPKALENVWNIDAIEFSLEQYQEASSKIAHIYALAYPGSDAALPNNDDLKRHVQSWHDDHPALSPVRFWRVLTTATVRLLDNAMDGEVAPAAKVYRDVMADLREM